MKEILYTIQDKEGLHARPACSMMMAVRNLDCQALVDTGKRTADMKNLMELMALGIRNGDQVIFRFSGRQEKEAVESVAAFLAQWK